ncbi:MAG: hypothetical protein HYV09_35610 [Deltaproteobacteria bacterium]|nr:hypothetical protein [Deltaproteobacteria bacterium]
MDLPPCTIAAETMHLDVGRGAAVATIDARIRGGPSGCRVDAGGLLRAREEGRSSPELVAWRAELDGRAVAMGGPRGRVIVVAPAGPSRVRLVAVLRGDRFVAAPLSTDASGVDAPVAFRATTRSLWGEGRIAGVARWTEVGAPIVVTIDPARDHEPPYLVARVVRGAPVAALVVDAGPVLGGDPAISTEEGRAAALRAGGVEALSVLLSDLPLAIATAPDATAVRARLREHANAARSAALARDPLWTAIGQRMATAMARAFTTCVRGPTTAMPARWPAPARELAATGLLDDAESGCPRIDDLLASNHPEFRFAQEAPAALGEATAASVEALPKIGPLVVAPARRPASRRPRQAIAAIAAAFGLMVAAFALALPARRRSL